MTTSTAKFGDNKILTARHNREIDANLDQNATCVIHGRRRGAVRCVGGVVRAVVVVAAGLGANAVVVAVGARVGHDVAAQRCLLVVHFGGVAG